MADAPLPTPDPDFITLDAIANAAKVSTSTVSRALRNDPRVAPATRQRIQDAAGQLGYRVNPLIAALMTRVRTLRPSRHLPTLAYFDTFRQRDEWKRYPTTRKLLLGARRRAEQLGYRLEYCWFHEPGISPQRWVEILRARGIPGLIIKYCPDNESLDHVLPMDVSGFAATTVEMRISSPEMHATANDQYQSATLALREMSRLGYRRIALVISDYNDFAFECRTSAAFRVYQSELPAADRLPLCRYHVTTFHAADFQRWLRQHRPDALLAFGQETARWLKELKLRAPEDLGFAHLDWDETMGDTAGVDQRNDLVGAAAVDLLTSHLHRNEIGIPSHPRLLLLEGKWVPGSTLRPTAVADTPTGKKRRAARQPGPGDLGDAWRNGLGLETAVAAPDRETV